MKTQVKKASEKVINTWKDLTIEQAAANLEALINQTPLKKQEYDLLYNSLATLFTTAKQTLEVVKDEKSA